MIVLGEEMSRGEKLTTLCTKVSLVSWRVSLFLGRMRRSSAPASSRLEVLIANFLAAVLLPSREKFPDLVPCMPFEPGARRHAGSWQSVFVRLGTTSRVSMRAYASSLYVR